jgi:hypothetical protein
VTHDKFCSCVQWDDTTREGHDSDCIYCQCEELAAARADEREKAALRIEALADREERESLMTWGQHFVHLGAFEACAKLVREGEQE